MSPSFGLFEAVGIELEYMIVDRETLAVRPIADQLLQSLTGHFDMEAEIGNMSWSNELALHVIELKTTDPLPHLQGAEVLFDEQVNRVEQALGPFGARLLPTAMHPLMDPSRELRLWPHGHQDIYAAFHRIFDCRGHGWANLQSIHLNLPFRDDEEFGRLHAAIRLVLPILPGLAASSPMADGRLTGLLDTRVDAYRHNSDRIPSVAGQVVPEPVFSRAEYEEQILAPLYEDLRPHDPLGVLRHEWVNARGCIARFDRMAIEIRLLDMQECPFADIAVAEAVTLAVRLLAEERTSSTSRQRKWPVSSLAAIFTEVVRDADGAVIRDPDYLSTLGFPGVGPSTVRALWRHLIGRGRREYGGGSDEWTEWFDLFGEQGTLARRICQALGPDPQQPMVKRVYRRLADCLRDGRLFEPDGL